MNRSKNIYYYLKTIIFTIAVLCGFTNPLSAQEKKKIELINADVLRYNADVSKDYRSLIGNVQLKHNDIILTCDSAHFYNESNKVDAFGKVHINQSDTLHLYGDRLFYDGNLKTAKADGNVRLVDRQMTLTTPDLFNDFNTSVATYSHGGKIVNKENTLTSTLGFYHSKSKMFSFRKNVTMKNPRYVMTSDTLQYNTVSRVAFFFGPTKILGDTNRIYCRSGWYDTQKDISQFNHNATLEKNAQILKGDSLYYNRKLGYGKAIGRVELIDTTQKITITGDFGVRNEKIDFAFVTGKNTLFQKFFEKDTLFMHADTLYSIKDTIPDERIFKAFHNVKLFKTDIQGLSDSLVYSTKDSLFRFYKSPIIWNDSNQLSGLYIELKVSKKEVESIYMESEAFIISERDTLTYNQIKGKSITGYFNESELERVYVDGNAQSVYYVTEDDGTLIGINKSKSSSMNISLDDKKIKKILFSQNPDAVLYPEDKINKDDLFLKGFVWHKNKRPQSRKDIF